MNTGYKYGRKTKAQIDALTGMEQGDNVYNTDIDKEEFYTGNVWINDDCIEMINDEGAAVSVGHLIAIDSDSATALHAELADSIDPGDAYTVGVCYRGGNNGAYIVVAQCGYYDVQVDSGTSAVTRGEIAELSLTNSGQIKSTGATTGGAACVGVFAESATGLSQGNLVKIFVQITDL